MGQREVDINVGTGQYPVPTVGLALRKLSEHFA
jgi:hypothetical protein